MSDAVLPHSEATGFHDLKPLPEFLPTSDIVQNIAVGLGVCILLFLAYRWLRRKRNIPEAPPLPPWDVLVQALEAQRRTLLDGALDAKVFGEAISRTFRQYLEATFEFPAEERTPGELRAMLAGILIKRLPLVPKSTVEEIVKQIIALLRETEHLIFAPPAAVRARREQAESLLENTLALGKLLQQHQEKEQQRKQSVTEV